MDFSKIRAVRRAENDLLNEWAEHEKCLVRDGIADPRQYYAERKQLLFVLKEPNDEGGGYWDMRPWARRGARPKTWNNLARWAHLIIDGEALAPGALTAEMRAAEIRRFAFINVKKRPGNSRSIPNEIRAVASMNRDLIRRQIELLSPSIVVLCGDPLEAAFRSIYTDEELRLDFKLENCRFGKLNGSTDFISFYHPQQRRYTQQNIEKILLAIKAALRG